MKKKITKKKPVSQPKNKKSPFPHYDRDHAAASFRTFCDTIAALRHPKDGCPWDLEQTHKSLTRYMLEEAYEAAEVMNQDNPQLIAEELGDVLLQVVLNAQLGADTGKFDLNDVIASIDAKMKRRHPHVFAKTEGGAQVPIDEVWRVYQEAKDKEKNKKPKATGVFEKVRHSPLPASMQALKIGEIAQRIKFDWSNTMEVFEQFLSEAFELRDAIRNKDAANIEEELGDAFFTLSQVCRHAGLNPESIAYAGNQKFLRRFASMEDLARKDGADVTKMSLAEQEEYWRRAKIAEKKPSRP